MVAQATLRKAIKRLLLETNGRFTADDILIMIVNETGFEYELAEVIDCLHDLVDDDEVVARTTYSVPY